MKKQIHHSDYDLETLKRWKRMSVATKFAWLKAALDFARETNKKHFKRRL